MQDSTRISVNRAVAALAGGLAVFLIMFVALLNPANSRVADLQKQLDASAFGAGRLLDEAKAQLAGKHYKEAEQALVALDQHHPVSTEATEGRALTAHLAAAQAKDDAAWALAVVGIRGKWIAAETTRIRAESEKGLQVAVEQNRAAAQGWAARRVGKVIGSGGQARERVDMQSKGRWKSAGAVHTLRAASADRREA
jgi:hypothetical protein